MTTAWRREQVERVLRDFRASYPGAAASLAALLVPDEAPSARSGAVDRDFHLQRVEMLQAEIDTLRGVDCRKKIDRGGGEEETGPCGVCIKCIRAERDASEAAARVLVTQDRRESRDHTQPGDWLMARRHILTRPAREG